MLLSFDAEMVGFDCLIRTDGVVDFSSDLICRGGIGGGRGRVVAFFFDSLSINKIIQLIKGSSVQ